MALDLSKLATAGVKIGMGLVGGSLEPVTMHLGHAGGAYDAASDSVEAMAGAADWPCKVLAFKRKNQESAPTQIVARKFTSDTETLLLQAAELAPGAIVTEEDTLTRADGQEWAILVVQPIPSTSPAAWLLDVRR